MVFITTSSSLFAATLAGTVTNKTTNKPAVGDVVVMLNLSQGMQEGGRTKTDAHGHFTLEPGDGPHLIRVDHEKASYFHMAPPGTTSIDMDVYDVLVKVPGVSTEADVIRVEADQQGLHVIENYFVKNESAPPKTQFSDHAYEIGLPPDAQIESSAALAPGGMPVSSSPAPLADKGHYAFIFPIRPGETRFQLSYRIPYSGSYKFAPRVFTPTETVAVMLPKSMTFAAGPATSYQTANEDINAQTFVAKNVSPSQPLDFTVTGVGSMPREDQGTPTQGGAPGQGTGGTAGSAGADTAQGAPTSASSDTRPGGGLGTPLDTPDPLTRYRGWILSGLAIVLAIGAALFLRRKPVPPQVVEQLKVAAPSVAPQAAAVSPGGLLGALKEELFTLETERLEGKIGDADYLQVKSALEVVLRRALARR